MFEIKNVSKQYGNEFALQNISLTIGKGMNFIVGASGSGKTTLLKILSGMEKDFDGEVLYCGQSVQNLSDSEKGYFYNHIFGFVWQDFHLLEERTVLENIMLPGYLNGVEEKSVEKLMKSLKIYDLSGQKVKFLSGGQKQRVAIARELMKDPQVLIADEPTGALDRTNSNEIMSLLKEAAQSRLVIVITHDPKICDFADEVIYMKEHNIVAERQDTTDSENMKLSPKVSVNPCTFPLGVKSFRIHFMRYMAVALTISIGVLAFLFSLSYENVMAKNIADFQEKNTAFGNGYVKTEKEIPELFSLLSDDERIENVYYQYVIRNVSLSIGGNTGNMVEKYPMPKATEKMSYGVMPRLGQNEIALSPSLAKKFDSQINNLIGKELILTYEQEEYRLTVSGIFNAGYDDFFVSADIEQALYEKADKTAPYALNYDVKRFEDVVSVTQMVKEQGVQPQTAANEVKAMQNTFYNIQNMFFIVSILVFAIAVFISAVLLVKMQNTRYHELGLLSALGFRKRTIRNMIFSENLLLSGLALLCNAVFVGLTMLFGRLIGADFAIGALELILSMLGTGIIVMLISMLAVLKPLNTEPAKALRK